MVRGLQLKKTINNSFTITKKDLNTRVLFCCCNYQILFYASVAASSPVSASAAALASSSALAFASASAAALA